MNCKYYKELISARLDGELSKEEEAILSQHLIECEQCSKVQEEFREQSEIQSTQITASIPSSVENAILRKTIESSRWPKSVSGYFRGHYKVPRAVAWGAAMAIIILLFAAIIQPFETVPALKMEQTAANGPTRVQKVILTENDIKETRIFTQGDNL